MSHLGSIRKFPMGGPALLHDTGVHPLDLASFRPVEAGLGMNGLEHPPVVVGLLGDRPVRFSWESYPERDGFRRLVTAYFPAEQRGRVLTHPEVRQLRAVLEALVNASPTGNDVFVYEWLIEELAHQLAAGVH
jgi:hypothetical protein